MLLYQVKYCRKVQPVMVQFVSTYAEKFSLRKKNDSVIVVGFGEILPKNTKKESQLFFGTSFGKICHRKIKEVGNFSVN